MLAQVASSSRVPQAFLEGSHPVVSERFEDYSYEMSVLQKAPDSQTTEDGGGVG